MARKKAARRPTKKSQSKAKRILFGYPLVIFLLLCTGIFLVLATFPGLADDIHVTAKVSAPFVSSPAVITNPANDTHFKGTPIQVAGTCPTNAAYVEVFRNNIMAGSAICDTNKTFQLQVDLLAGENDLAAHVFNMTDDEGPVSATVKVFYDVLQPPGAPSPSPSPTKTNPLIAQTDFIYKGYLLDDLVQWPVQICGGQPPYTATVDWGDNSQSTYANLSSGALTVSHRYLTLPKDRSFTIKVTVQDSRGNHAFLQFFVIVTDGVASAPAANIFSKTPPSINSRNWLWWAWPAYAAVVAMVLSYWLGEREELIILKKRGLLKRRR